MGFWQTGYMEFHEPTGGFNDVAVPLPVTYACGTCGITFRSERDLRVHAFHGHTLRRPVLVYDGRECGRSRLTITSTTSASDWAVSDADTVLVNGKPTTAACLPEVLSAQRSGVVDVTLANSQLVQDFQFEFALSEAEDLAGVDAALDRLIGSGELSVRAIDAFIMRSKHYPTAGRYLAGIANYLYGVLAREGLAESGVRHESTGYEGKYDQAVSILRSFDRPPAEAVCGIVAFHYNQFARAMSRTRSQRVAEVSLRFKGMLGGAPWPQHSLLPCSHTSLDFALSDSVTERVLAWCAMPLDGTAGAAYAELCESLEAQRPYDAFKLHLLAAEHTLAAGDPVAAGRHAEQLRHGRVTEDWYGDFRRRQ